VLTSARQDAWGRVEVAVSDAEHWFPSHVKALAEEECWELLAGQDVGRVAYCDDRGPVVLPVNYSLDRQTILIRLAPYSRLAVHLEDALASFQIDEYDHYNQSGWSVLLRGQAAHIDAATLRDQTSQPFPWAEGERSLLVRIAPDEVTGRRLLPA
jgi:uncharacterized protein